MTGAIRDFPCAVILSVCLAGLCAGKSRPDRDPECGASSPLPPGFRSAPHYENGETNVIDSVEMKPQRGADPKQRPAVHPCQQA